MGIENDIFGVLLEKTKRLERLNEIVVELAAGVAVITGGLGWKEQLKYANIGEFVYTMDVVKRSKTYADDKPKDL